MSKRKRLYVTQILLLIHVSNQQFVSNMTKLATAVTTVL